MMLEKVFGNEMLCCRSGPCWGKVFDNKVLCFG